MAKRSKKYIEAFNNLDRSMSYDIQNAIGLIKKIKFAKFDETIDLSVKLNLRKSHAVRSVVVLPNQFMKEKKILVFAKDEKAREAREAGATYVGDDDLILKIRNGWSDFDIVVATPDLMREVGKLGPILGRRGLMPNPKTQTVTNELRDTINQLKQGRIEFRANKNGIVSIPIGKASMADGQVKDNYEVFISELIKKRPSDLKGVFVGTVYVSTTMGPSVKINFS